MTPQQFWTAITGIAIVLVGVVIVGVVAYLLYVRPSSQSDSERTVVYECPGVTVVSFFSGDQVRVTFSDGRSIDAFRVPSDSTAPPGSESWVRHVSSDRSFALITMGERAIVEERGGEVSRECIQSQE